MKSLPKQIHSHAISAYDYLHSPQSLSSSSKKENAMNIAPSGLRAISFRTAKAGRLKAVDFEPMKQTQLIEADANNNQHLTRRELEVLSLLCAGSSNKTIARELRISSSTVKVYVAKILFELRVTSRLQAVVEAYRRGIVTAGAVTLRTEAHVFESATPYRDLRMRAAHMI